MNGTGIIQRVSSIAMCNVNDLEQVLEEALEKVLHFERLNARFANFDGVLTFCNVWMESLEFKGLNKIKDEKIIEHKFMEITGGMTFNDLNHELDKCLGPETTWSRIWYIGWGRLLPPKNRKKFLDYYNKKVIEYKPILSRAASEMEQSAVMLIPPKYRYPLALMTMLEFIRNYRASSWKECVEKFEKQLHRWRIEADSAENLRIQREISGLTKRAADSATVAVIFSGLNFLLK